MKITNYFFICLFILSNLLSTSYAAERNEELTIKTPDDIRLAMRYPEVRRLSWQQQKNDAGGEHLATTGNLQEKNKGKAFLYSLLLPGAGEYYIGKKTTAKVFFFTEVVLWAGLFSFDAYSNWKRDDMYIFSAEHSGAEARGKPAQYFVDIGNYDNIYEYNEAKQLQREFYKVYDEEEYYWSWDSDKNRRKFERMRISSDKAHNRAIFAIGGIIANHLVSAIDAVWQSYRYNKALKKKQATNRLRLKFDAHPAGYYSMTLEKSFSF